MTRDHATALVEALIQARMDYENWGRRTDREHLEAMTRRVIEGLTTVQTSKAAKAPFPECDLTLPDGRTVKVVEDGRGDPKLIDVTDASLSSQGIDL